VTKLKKSMKNKFLALADKLPLQKWALIDGQRPVKEHLTDRAHAPPLLVEFLGQRGGGADSLTRGARRSRR